MGNKKRKKKLNNKMKRIHRSELQKINKQSEKLIYDAELGVDMNDLIASNLTIADLKVLSNNENSDLNKFEPALPIFDFLSSETYENLLPEDSGISEVACTCAEPNNKLEACLDIDSTTSKNALIGVSTDELIFAPHEEEIISLSKEAIPTVNIEDQTIATDIEEPTVISDIKSIDSANPTSNVVISFPIDTTALREKEAEKQKKELEELNEYLEEEAKFKEFDKKLITLTREKLTQKKQSTFSKFLNKLFV